MIFLHVSIMNSNLWQTCLQAKNKINVKKVVVVQFRQLWERMPQKAKLSLDGKSRVDFTALKTNRQWIKLMQVIILANKNQRLKSKLYHRFSASKTVFK